MQWIKGFLTAIGVTLIVASLSYAQICVICHPEGQVINNCLAQGCHDTYDNGNHHTTDLALAGICTPCHDPVIVDNYNDENPLSYPATMITPKVENCTVCHKGHANPLDENGIPYPHPIYETVDLEHLNYQGHSVYCSFCHGDPPIFDPEDPYLIRYCETCHSVQTLHAISGHVESGYWYDENGDWTYISDYEKCLGCHDGSPQNTMLYVQQAVGTFDTKFSELSEVDCRVCHGTSTAATHHTVSLTDCTDPPLPPTIETNACEGMSPVVGTRLAHMTLTGTDFGDNGQLPMCGTYEVQMQEGVNWVNVPATTWTDTLIDWTLPPSTFTPNAYHNVRVETSIGTTNERQFYLLAPPVVDHIEDDTGGNAKGLVGGWLTIYSDPEGTFSDAREKWYEDTLGVTCPNFFGTIYVVKLTASSRNYCVTIYDQWDVSGDSFKIQLTDLWEDDDGDYYKDATEPLCGPERSCEIPLGSYSVQVALIIYADTNDDDVFSGDEDTIYQVVKSKSDIIYDIAYALCECTLVPDDTVIPRGGTLGLQATVTNYTDKSGTVLFATDVTLPNGNRYPASGYLFGPFSFSLGPDQSKSKHLLQAIPSNAPIGTYTYHGYVGRPGPIIYDECTFSFDVIQ